MKYFDKWKKYAAATICSEAVWLVMAVCITIGSLIGVFRLWETDLSVMLCVQEDSIGLATLAQNYVSGISRNDLLLMPFAGISHSSITSAFTQRLLLRVISIFCSSFGLACNVLYLLGYILVAICMYIVLRIMKIHGSIACALCVVYTFLPYHYMRGESHIYLGMYYMVPFSCLLIFQVLLGEVCLSKDRTGKENRRFFMFLFAVIVLAVTDIYYMVFTFILLVIAGAIKSVWESRMQYFKTAILLSGAMLVTTAIVNMSYFFTIIDGEQVDASITNRNLGDLELYALRISQLLLPIQGHRINFLNLIREQYDQGIPDTESRMVSLGMIMSAGFLISLFFGLIYPAKTEEGIKLRHLGLLNMGCILFSTVGGLQVFIGMISPAIRCYNRMSVFIATFSIMTIAVLLQQFYRKGFAGKWKKYLFYICLIVLVAGGIYDQTTEFDRLKYQENLELDNNIRNMVQNLEDSVPEGSMIFMMPAVFAKEDSEIFQMRSYEQQWPVLYSDTLRWSSTNSLGLKDQNRQWKKALSVMEMQDMLENVCVTGFAGVWLDENGYAIIEFSKIQKEIETYLGKPQIVSGSGRQFYYSMDEFRKRMEERYTDKELEKMRRESLELGNDQGDYYNADSLYFQGDIQSGDAGAKRLMKGSIQYGPYINLEKGMYWLEINGSSLSEESFSITKNQGEGNIDYTFVETGEKKMIVEFQLDQVAKQVEFILENSQDTTVEIQYYYLEETDGKDKV